MSINSKMTAIANPIRTLKGTSGAMGLDAMASNLGEVVNECDTQADLITQIKTALADKAAGGVELPTLTNPGTASDLAEGKQLIDADGNVVDGTYVPLDTSDADATAGRILKGYTAYVNGKKITGNLNYLPDEDGTTTLSMTANSLSATGNILEATKTFEISRAILPGSIVKMSTPLSKFGNATAADVRQGKTFTSAAGLLATGEALLPGGGSVYPEGAFAPVTNFTDGKQYALVAVIDGVRRYINTTTYNDYTMNATQINIAEDAGDYVIFGATPALFTAVASGDGFLLQNGSNYLHGTSSGGTALRVGTTQMVWTVDTSATGGFSDGKYYAKEDANAVWLMNADGGYSWSIKYETAGSFGYDRDGRDGTYSTGFVSFVLYEYVAGEGEINPVVDTSDATATSNDIVVGKNAYVNGRKVDGGIFPLGSTGMTPDRMSYADGVVTLTPRIGQRMYLIDTSTIKITASDLGNATAADVASGKTFTSAAGLKVTGTATMGDTGSTIKTGTTTSGTINTGLSDIEQFFIYKETQTATGLIHLHYTKDATSRMYASAWSTQNYGTKTITNGTGGVTVSGGTLTISATQAAQGALTSGVTYKWVAIGK